MKNIFPGAREVPVWHKAALGSAPFPCDSAAASASFFRPAAALCRRAVPAEKKLSPALPQELRKNISMALRLWQRSQEVTQDFISGGRLLPGMDMPMTLNFAMALGNYSRFFLFEAGNLIPRPAALKLHAAFAAEMQALPAAMAARRAMRGKRLAAQDKLFFGAHSPQASALRLAAACSRALGRVRV